VPQVAVELGAMSMVARPNYPIENVREFQRRLYIVAKRIQERSIHAVLPTLRSDVLPEVDNDPETEEVE
jgi:hypothetical protein